MKKFQFSYTAGDPGFGIPVITLQKDDGLGAFSDVVFPSGRVYDNAYNYNLFLEWTNTALTQPRCTDCPDLNTWFVTFEETKNFPLGSYRFKIQGKYYTGSKTTLETDKIKDYTIFTDAFGVIPTARMQIHDLAFDATSLKVSGGIAYPTGPTTDPGYPEPFDGLKQAGLILHSAQVPAYVGGPVPIADLSSLSIVLTPQGGGTPITIEASSITKTEGTHARTVVIKRTVDSGTSEVTETTQVVDGGFLWPALLFEAAIPNTVGAGTYDMAVSVTDVNGNSGQVTMPITLQ
jgi:hypothetical protein